MLDGIPRLTSEWLGELEERGTTGVVVVMHASFATLADEVGKKGISTINEGLFERAAGVPGVVVAALNMSGLGVFVKSEGDLDRVTGQLREATRAFVVTQWGEDFAIDVTIGAASTGPDGLSSAVHAAAAEAISAFQSLYADVHELPPFPVLAR